MLVNQETTNMFSSLPVIFKRWCKNWNDVCLAINKSLKVHYIHILPPVLLFQDVTFISIKCYSLVYFILSNGFYTCQFSFLFQFYCDKMRYLKLFLRVYLIEFYLGFLRIIWNKFENCCCEQFFNIVSSFFFFFNNPYCCK